MSISTKTGDGGETSLYDGSRISKASRKINSVGYIDELNSEIGLIVSKTYSQKFKTELKTIQNELFVIGSDLATPMNSRETKRLQERHLQRIEKYVEKYETEVEITDFVLPGGTEIASLFHIVRTQSRNVERKIVRVSEVEEINPIIIKYLNRLSDLFYLMALYENKNQDQKEESVNFDI
ncbi:MAG: ATP:cob(I)alamin adenosyltransferase [uncultured DHVE6 group euryarchaeote]|jgi:cob(I)alamin adenosyltransferase|nr:cob(I)yrinic acid a,c-diamide adenosyltransferase [Candidatus Woesearchaeota archaeon]MBT6023362.1 cob(I)yrinic acid a,c-diamide adenosyltransferase [Candidatus Woesearchaeota archaeon]RZD30713.1 MAG: ATP:cob(I)alamin adenosyltransferase [uncultured DHVE6 group euryarchaeote]